MGERDDRRAFQLAARADAVEERERAEQPADGQPADRDDQLGTQELELPLEPERTELLLAWGGRPIAAPRESVARIAARDRGAVEGPVEGALVEAEPGSQRLTGATPPGSPLRGLYHPGRLAEHVGALAGTPLEDRGRLERVARLDAGSTGPVVSLQREQRAVARASPRHGETTATNQRAACRTRPPPSSASRSSGSKTLLKTRQRDPSFRTRSSQRSRSSPAPGRLPTMTSSGATRRASARKRRRSGSSRWQ